MRKKGLKKPKKIVFEKLTVKEKEKVRGGDDIDIHAPARPCIK
jgi:hypothetical protein